MKKEEVIAISRRLEKAGLTVRAFVSPMFQIGGHPANPVAPARSISRSIQGSCPAENLVDHAMEIAVILGAPHMRIFSYLRYPGFRPKEFGWLSKGCRQAACARPSLRRHPCSSRTSRSATSATSPSSRTFRDGALVADGWRRGARGNRARGCRKCRATSVHWSTSPTPGRPAKSRAIGHRHAGAADHRDPSQDRNLEARRTVPWARRCRGRPSSNGC